MKLNDIENLTVKTPQQNPCQASDVRDEQHQKDKEFMHAMNEFTAEAGLLSDDPFFEGV